MAWGDCSKTCGDGIQVRFRDKTPAANGGKECDGKPTDDRSCYDNFCPGKYIKVKYISISVKLKKSFNSLWRQETTFLFRYDG